MNELDEQIREHIDAVAPPISLGEAVDRYGQDESSARRWPLAVAATLLLAFGVGAVALAAFERESTDVGVAVQPEQPPVPSPPPVVAPSVAARIVELDIPAGLTVEQTGELLASSLDWIDAAEFARAAEAALIESDFRTDPVVDDIESVEGLLASGTYEISETESESDMARRMVDAMNEVGARVEIQTGGAALGRSPYEILIIASLIEREAPVPGDRGRISRVMHNRLFVTDAVPDDPFPLQIDSAVLYGRDQVGLDPNIAFSELRTIPTDWNTYVLPGLPATPIATPSQASIEAALQPAPNPGPGDPICVDLPDPDECFLFFYVLGAEDGSMSFAATGEQHQANVERARELGLI